MSLLVRTDVTAVKLHESFIFAGIGSSLNVFEKQTGKELQRILCLNGQKIYGIVVFGNKLLIFGGKQFTLLNLEDEHFVRDLEAVVCDDWIHSGVWIDENTVALLTAHNIIEYWHLSPVALKSRIVHEDNSILYSGLLVHLDNDEVIVLAGMVFSQVIVHCQGDTLHRLDGHKGVIFSISCNQEQGIIVTTSDDRSVRIWGPNPLHSLIHKEQWTNTTITCKHELYGHAARVMRSCITNKYVISVGEDSVICFWEEGRLAKKLSSHQNSPIWSVDADKDSLVTGGGDASVIIHPLSLAKENTVATLNINIEAPKKILFTARRNIIALNELNDLLYYNLEDNSEIVYKLDHISTYKVVSLSVCKQIVAVADMNGKLDVFIENCKEKACLIKIIDTKLDIDRVMSLHWAGNRSLVICADKGVVYVLASNNTNVENCAKFELPLSKERWLTAAAVDNSNNVFILGDRCGNIHVFVKGKRDPIKSFNKVHGRYGPTSIIVKDNEVISTGRNGIIKYFSKDNDTINYMSNRDLEFQWIEKFLDKDENIVCGFQERVFIVYDLKRNSKVVEITCGGGHRSWDAIRYYDKIDGNYQEIIKFIYLKNSEVKMATFVLNELVSRNIVNGSHSKEINCLKVVNIDEVVFALSGGEDTTLRVTTLYPYEDKAIFKHLSNIKTIKIKKVNDNVLVITGGGRAQICIKLINLKGEKIKSKSLIDYMIKGTDKNRKNNQNWRSASIDFDPETRIVDVDFIQIDTIYEIFAGCSDGYLRIFRLDDFDKPTFKMIEEINYHKTCILKTVCVKYLNFTILITCTTTGNISFWDTVSKRAFFDIKANKNGINSVASKEIDNKLLLATGGDDNSIHINLLALKNQNDLTSLTVLQHLILDQYHSSQITGLLLIDKYLISTSIDQRVTLFEWKLNDTFTCDYVSQCCSDVADIQGMELVNVQSSSIEVCVFGKGVEIISIKLPAE